MKAGPGAVRLPAADSSKRSNHWNPIISLDAMGGRPVA